LPTNFLAVVSEGGKVGEVAGAAGVQIVVAQRALHRVGAEQAHRGERRHQPPAAQILPHLRTTTHRSHGSPRDFVTFNGSVTSVVDLSLFGLVGSELFSGSGTL
jgi:hypothetical protein